MVQALAGDGAVEQLHIGPVRLSLPPSPGLATMRTSRLLTAVRPSRMTTGACGRTCSSRDSLESRLGLRPTCVGGKQPHTTFVGQHNNGNDNTNGNTDNHENRNTNNNARSTDDVGDNDNTDDAESDGTTSNGNTDEQSTEHTGSYNTDITDDIDNGDETSVTMDTRNNDANTDYTNATADNHNHNITTADNDKGNPDLITRMNMLK